MATSNEKTELTIRSISVAWLVKSLLEKYAPEFSDDVDWEAFAKTAGKERKQLSVEKKRFSAVFIILNGGL